METNTQYLEYLYDLPSDEDTDWMTENYNYPISGITCSILTRYSATGVSRSTWEAAYIMGLELEYHLASYVPHLESIKVLELGSGTGLGGIHFAKLMNHMGRNYTLYMSDVCEKSLKLISKNVK